MADRRAPLQAGEGLVGAPVVQGSGGQLHGPKGILGSFGEQQNQGGIQ